MAFRAEQIRPEPSASTEVTIRNAEGREDLAEARAVESQQSLAARCDEHFGLRRAGKRSNSHAAELSRRQFDPRAKRANQRAIPVIDKQPSLSAYNDRSLIGDDILKARGCRDDPDGRRNVAADGTMRNGNSVLQEPRLKLDPWHEMHARR